MANLKPITEVPCVNEVPEGAELLLIADGAARRISVENVRKPVRFRLVGDADSGQLYHEDGTTKATASEVYEAYLSGYTQLEMDEGNEENPCWVPFLVSAAAPISDDSGNSLYALLVGNDFLRLNADGSLLTE